MNKITLDDLINKINEAEENTVEPMETEDMLHNVATMIEETAKGTDKIKILTDYDADGICSAYIIEKAIKAINSDADLIVQCNDRRESYGISPDIQAEENTKYIVLDMGSNQLDFVREKLGDDVIILDHHLISDDETRKSFIEDSHLCNPHAFHKDDSKNSQYCATGLAYRCYDLMKSFAWESNYDFITDKVQENTILAIACIGTATDMVNVLDKNSYNRDILKKGIAIINNADKSNIDINLLCILSECGIGGKTGENECTAYQLAFNVGSFLNSASRMSELINKNGAELMYKALTGNPEDIDTYLSIKQLLYYNKTKKEIIQQIQNSTDYKTFVKEQCLSDNSSIAVFLLDDDIPTSFCGLIAGKLVEETDKAIICLTYNKNTNTWSGSGRNADNNESLKEFIDLLSKEPEFENINIKYGGHHDAIGISSLDNITAFRLAINKYSNLLHEKNNELVILDINETDLNSSETFQKLKQLEPTGIGLSVPPILVTDTITDIKPISHSKLQDKWKVITLENIGKVKDWSYLPDKYISINGQVKFFADIKLIKYYGDKIELQSKWNKKLFEENQKELKKNQEIKDNNLKGMIL